MKMNYSPYIFLPVQNRVFTVANLNKKQDSTLKKGTEITRINGVEVDSILSYCRRFISSDGYNRSGKEHFVQLGFNSYFLGLFGRPDTFEVEYREGKKTKTLRYPAIRLKSLPALPLGAKVDSLLTRYKRAKINYRFLDDEKKTAYMQLEKFAHRSDARVYRRIFRKLQKNQSENLVLDLRNNGGGSLANSYRLLSYLLDEPATQTLRTHRRNYPYRKYTKGNLAFKFTRLAYRIIGKQVTRHDTDYFVYTIRPRKKDHFNGRLFVLINGGSFSASCLVAAYLRQNPRATFIGEETGGTIEGCNAGITPCYHLPKTRIRVRVPAFRIIHDPVAKVTGQGILPDIHTEYGYRDIVTKRDLELQKVKEILNIR
jgi:C-terminal processing protease CtpA/Prc